MKIVCRGDGRSLGDMEHLETSFVNPMWGESSTQTVEEGTGEESLSLGHPQGRLRDPGRTQTVSCPPRPLVHFPFTGKPVLIVGLSS